MIGIAISALAAYKLCEPLGGQYPLFGISMAAVGMLSIVGITISNDAFGPIVDNAREMCIRDSLIGLAINGIHIFMVAIVPAIAVFVLHEVHGLVRLEVADAIGCLLYTSCKAWGTR